MITKGFFRGGVGRHDFMKKCRPLFNYKMEKSSVLYLFKNHTLSGKIPNAMELILTLKPYMHVPTSNKIYIFI